MNMPMNRSDQDTSTSNLESQAAPSFASASPQARAAFSHLAQMHLDEVANLWSVWHSALSLPHYDRQSLVELEQRLQSHIVGMRLHEHSTWQRCVDDLDIADAGEVFAAAQLAFRSYDVDKIKLVVKTASEDEHRMIGLMSALAWLPIDIADPWLNKFLKSKQLQHKWIALEAHRWREEPHPQALVALVQRADCQQHPQLLRALLRSVGEFKVTQAAALLSDLPASVWTAYARALLGDKSVLDELKTSLESSDIDPEARMCAAHVLFRLCDSQVAQQTIRSLAENPATQSLAVLGAAMLGDIQVIPWLIGQMHDLRVARLAGLAFTTLTGCDIEEHDYQLAEPPVGQDDEIDETLPGGFMESLVWPNPEIVWQVWEQHLAPRYPSGVRYLMGAAIGREHCEKWLNTGNQFVRCCASYELALNNPPLGLYNTRGIQHPES